MARLKNCPDCHGKHRKRSAFLRCHRRKHMESWKV